MRRRSGSSRARDRRAALWRCAKCGREFANRNQGHTCGLHTLEAHFAKSTPEVRKLFRRFVSEARKCGPLRVLPEKTRIALHVRMSFAAVALRKSALTGHLVLARRRELPCFTRVETLSPRNHVHHFRIRSTAGLTDEFLAALRSAYAVGEQNHLHYGPSRTEPQGLSQKRNDRVPSPARPQEH